MDLSSSSDDEDDAPRDLFDNDKKTWNEFESTKSTPRNISRESSGKN